jgi:hypothetical protein
MSGHYSICTRKSLSKAFMILIEYIHTAFVLINLMYLIKIQMKKDRILTKILSFNINSVKN